MSFPTGYFTARYVSSIDDSEQPFALWVPRSHSRRRQYPLIVALHGSDADHRMIPEECFRMHERGFPVCEAVGDARAKVARHFSDHCVTEVAPHDVAPEG